MAIFSYTKIADYILDQFWGFVSANSLKNSVRHVAEDVLGLTDGLGTDVTFPTEVKGERVVLSFGVNNVTGFLGSDRYLLLGSASNTIEHSYSMPRPGSVVSYSIGANVTTYVSTTIFTPTIRKNGSTLITGNSTSLTSATFFNDRGTFLRNVNTFVAGDRLSFFIDNTTVGNTDGNAFAMIEVQFDT